MDAWEWSLILRPLGLVILFGIVWIIARAILWLIPDGRLKRILSFSWKV